MGFARLKRPTDAGRWVSQRAFTPVFDRKAHWQNIYQHKSPLDVSWYQKEPNLSLELIHHAAVQHDEPIIDVGGGASVLVDRLLKEGFTRLSVLDISANALASAKSRLADAGKEIEWIEADVTEFHPPHQFSLWHDRAVFHFLTEESDRRRYARVLTQALRPEGHLIIAAFSIGGPDRCSGLDVVQYDSSRLTSQLGEGFVLREEMEEIHVTPENKEQKFTYFRFVRKANET